MKKSVLFLFLLFTFIYAQAQSDNFILRKVAFVIGNAKYEQGQLYNPINDSKDIANTLQELGFDVFIFENIEKNSFFKIINQYQEVLAIDPKHTLGLFYYSGHGWQINGKNYLVPVDAHIQTITDADVWGVNTDMLMGALHKAKNSMNIIVLDACRADPFLAQYDEDFGEDESGDEGDSEPVMTQYRRGLAPMDAPVGTYIAFATAPGGVASDGEGLNGLYTQELIKALKIPDLTIEQVFKKVRTQVKELSGGNQIPWDNSSFESKFYFRKSNQTVTKGTITTPKEDTTPLPERYAHDVCACLISITSIMEKIEQMPQNTNREKLDRLTYEANVATQQSENCLKNIFNHYPSIPTKAEEEEAKQILKRICPAAYQFISKK